MKSEMLVLTGLLLAAGARAQTPASDIARWPEDQRAFFQDGPALLFSAEQRAELRGLDEAARGQKIAELLDRDPILETPANELREGIDRRRRLAAEEFLSAVDVRSQILFLNGRPEDRLVIDCGAVFKPMEIWSYPGGVSPEGKPTFRRLVVFTPGVGEPYRLWIPSDGKRALYTPLMEYWLDQWEELRGRIRAVRFDLQNCKEARQVDEATGVPGLTGALGNGGARIRPIDASRFLKPPADLAKWAQAATATELSSSATPLKIESVDFRFPEREGQRVVARALLGIGTDSGLQPAEATRPGAAPEVGVVIEGVLEQDGKPFEDFRMRFRLPVPAPGEPALLAVDRPLRPKSTFVMRLKVKDETSGAQTVVSRAFTVPAEHTPEARPAGQIGGELLPETAQQGRDSLLLVPPPADVVVGLWRADALVNGDRIKKVVFLVDGKVQLARTSPPYSAELRLEKFPVEQIVRAEGYDPAGELVASDEVILNIQRGGLAVRIVAPAKGEKLKTGKTLAKAEIVVPDGRRLTRVEFKVNDETVAALDKAPWQAEVPVPDVELAYLTVVATLDDESKAEAVRYLKSPQYIEEVEVNLVELYVAVAERSGEPVRGLKQEDFEVTEAGKPQEIAKFELVDTLPLSIGVLLDTSGSMASSLVEAQRAVSGFLEGVMTPKDKAFAVSFARRPRLDMPPTDDVGAVVNAINGLQAVGDTALHDALIQSLYYFRGMQGQRALVLLSDGDDNASFTPFKDALEYASRSGVAIYVIGYNLTALEANLRQKLTQLAEATGGRAFWAKPEDLPGIYKQIETELRSRYLVAYNSDQPGGQGGFRPVEVKVKKGGLKARTARGYYP